MMPDPVTQYFQATSYAVAGASNDRNKFGNKVFRTLLQHDLSVVPINPNNDQVEGHTCYASLSDAPEPPQSLSIVTPPEITRQVVADAIEAGVKVIWMQPGAEDDRASQSAREQGITVIDDGRCVLVEIARQR